MESRDLQLINEKYDQILESVLQVPYDILKPIIEFYLENYKKYKKNGPSVAVNDTNYPPKKFLLDFTGSSYEFLNDYNKTVEVHFKAGRGAHYIENRDGTKRNIFIGLGINPEDAMTDTIQHEVSHFIQYLIQAYHYEMDSSRDVDTLKSQYPLGGIVSKKLLKGDVDTEGYTIGGTRRKRVEHTRQPVEMLTDLTTAINELQYLYYLKIKDKENYKELIKSESSRKDFFMSFLKALQKGIDFGYFPVKNFIVYKKYSAELYQEMISKAYNEFVNNPPNFDTDYIEAKLKEISKEDPNFVRNVYTDYESKARSEIPAFSLDSKSEVKEGRMVHKIIGYKDDGTKYIKSNGFIQSEKNIKKGPKDSVWVFDDAAVVDDAMIMDNAKISDEALIYGNAVIKDSATVSSNGKVGGDSQVSKFTRIGANVSVSGESKIVGGATNTSWLQIVAKNKEVNIKNAIIVPSGMGKNRSSRFHIGRSLENVVYEYKSDLAQWLKLARMSINTDATSNDNPEGLDYEITNTDAFCKKLVNAIIVIQESRGLPKSIFTGRRTLNVDVKKIAKDMEVSLKHCIMARNHEYRFIFGSGEY